MDFTRLFLNSALKNEAYLEALDIVRQNSYGKIWLVGGFVYRNIVKSLYGKQFPDKVDLDFIVEMSVDKLNYGSDWKKKATRYGCLRFVKDKIQIDFIPLKKIFFFSDGVEPSIDNYFIGVPFDIQAIAYDFNTNQIIGDVGKKAIESKIVTINNYEHAIGLAQNTGICLQEIIKEKADSLGFNYVLHTV